MLIYEKSKCNPSETPGGWPPVGVLEMKLLSCRRRVAAVFGAVVVEACSPFAVAARFHSFLSHHIIPCMYLVLFC